MQHKTDEGKIVKGILQNIKLWFWPVNQLDYMKIQSDIYLENTLQLFG